MPAFLVDPAHADVQQVILDRLAEPSIHELLPLLRVCRYLRQLVIQRVVALFSRPGTPYGRQYIGRALKPRPGDGFIKMCQRDFPFADFGPTMNVNDPRRLFSDPADDPIRRDQHTGEVEDELFLHLAKYDPQTQLCTFEPVDKRNNSLYGHAYYVSVDSSTYKLATDCDAIPAVFQASSSHWFRPAFNGKNSYYGLQLGGRPDLHPSRAPVFWPQAHEERGEAFTDDNAQFTNGWKAAYYTRRTDYGSAKGNVARCGEAWLQVDLVVTSVEIPLIDLLCPPVTAQDDISGYDHYGDFDFDEYIADQYDTRHISPACELELAHEHAMRGGVI
ncbi:hypothetical protein JCM10450v2_002187 [Rhodotorula kratochvilovae]